MHTYTQMRAHTHTHMHTHTRAHAHMYARIQIHEPECVTKTYTFVSMQYWPCVIIILSYIIKPEFPECTHTHIERHVSAYPIDHILNSCSWNRHSASRTMKFWQRSLKTSNNSSKWGGKYSRMNGDPRINTVRHGKLNQTPRGEWWNLESKELCTSSFINAFCTFHE